jgi:hypothetical protein
LLIVGMTSLVRQAKRGPGVTDPRLAQLLARKPARVATVAMANRAARVIWAIMTCQFAPNVVPPFALNVSPLTPPFAVARRRSAKPLA